MHNPSISQKHLHQQTSLRVDNQLADQQQIHQNLTEVSVATVWPDVVWGHWEQLKSYETLQWEPKVCQTQTLQNKNNIGLWHTTERVQPKLSKSPEIAQAKEKAYLTKFYAGTQKKKMVGFDPFHNFSAPHQLLRLIKNAPRTVKHTHPSHILCISFDMHIIKRRKNWWERQMEQLDILQIILWIVSTWGTHARLTKRKASIPCDSSIDPYNAKSSMDGFKEAPLIEQTHESVCAVNLLDVSPQAQSISLLN